ncbi:DUF4387 domain-containing protein [Paraburkholderia fungorum]|jgi:Domain of unknown function (DUF4387)|uniref:DUF4387 domain-containing protein n=1 Tax=Paraburkholderia fungorum TaxID=134537 RepID=UPI0038B94A27
MTCLAKLARLIRSKNAGPFQLTFDVMFSDEETYRRVKNAGVISSELVARLYNVDEKKVMFFLCDNALAVKITIPRPHTQGDPLDSDSHGGQQYAPLMDIEIP